VLISMITLPGTSVVTLKCNTSPIFRGSSSTFHNTCTSRISEANAGDNSKQHTLQRADANSNVEIVPGFSRFSLMFVITLYLRIGMSKSSKTSKIVSGLVGFDVPT